MQRRARRVAALAHRCRPRRRSLLHAPRANTRRLDDNASELFGAQQRKGLLYWLPPEGTLLLNNVHKAPAAVRAGKRFLVCTTPPGLPDSPLRPPLRSQALALLQRECALMSSTDDDDQAGAQEGVRLSGPRVIMTAASAVPDLAQVSSVIKVRVCWFGGMLLAMRLARAPLAPLTTALHVAALRRCRRCACAPPTSLHTKPTFSSLPQQSAALGAWC